MLLVFGTQRNTCEWRVVKDEPHIMVANISSFLIDGLLFMLIKWWFFNLQANQALIEAIENHMPLVIVID